MWLSSDQLMIIIGTLLVQCCFAHESFSSIKNSSGRSARLDAESQSIQISDSQLSNPSFSKSESKLSASETEISEKASNFVSVGDNVEMQDSSYYSSNNNASGSDSNIRVSDKGISQTETSFSTASSTMADVDSSFVSTPNGTASSVSKSFSETKKSSSSSSTKSINGQFLGPDELKIDQGGLPEDSLRPRNSFSHTRSLDSSSLPTGNPNIKPFSNSGLPSGFSNLPNSVVKNEIPRPGGPKSNYLRVGSFNSNSRPGEDLFTKPNFIGTEDTMKSIDISGSDESTFHKPLSPDTPLGSLYDNNLNHPNAPLFKDSFDNELSPLSSPDTLLDDEINSSTLSDLSPDTPLGSLSDSNLNHPNAPLFEDSFDNELSPLSSPDTLLDDEINSSTLSDTTIPLADNFPTSESSSPNIPLPTEEGTEEYLNISDSLDNTPTNLEESPAQPSNSLDSLINSSSLPSDIPLEVSPFEDSPITSDISNDTFSTNESPTITSADLPSSNIDFPFPQQTSQAYEEPCDSETHPPPIDSSSLFDQYDSPTFPSDTHFTEPTNQLPDVNPKNPLNTYPSFDSSFNSLYEGDTPFAPASHLESSKTQSLPSNDIHNDLPSPSFELQQPHDLLPGSPNIDEFIIPQDNVGYPNSPDASHNSILSESPNNELPNDFLISELESKPISESINSLDTNRDDFISPEEILKANDQPPLPTLHSSPVNKHSKNSDHLPSSRPRYDGHKNFPKKNKFWKPSRGSKQSVSSNQLPPYAYFNSNYPGFGYPAYSHLPPQFNNSPSRNSPLFPAHYPLPLHPNGHPPFVRPSSYDFDRFYAFNPPTSHYQKHYNNPSSYLDMPYGPSLTQLSQKPTPYYFQNPIESPPQLHQQSIFDTKIASTPFEPDQEEFPYRNSPPSGVPIMINSMPDSSNAYLFGQPEIFSSVPQLLSSPPYKPKKWPLHSPLQSKPESYGLNTTPILPQQSSSLIDLEASNYSPLPTPLDMESLSQSPSLDSATPNTNLLMNSSSSQLPSLDSSPRLDSPTSYPFVKDSQVPYLNLPPSVPLSNSPDDFSDLFNGSKRRYEIANSEYLLSNSMYPKDISNTLDVITDEELKYNIVIVGSSPAIMAALKPLLDLEKRILVVERGTLPPLISKSLYYRPKMMQSDYVRKIKASAPHCDVEKIIYAPNVLGEESTYDSNIWDYGVKSKYIKWGKLCKKWTWSKILSYFPDDNDQLTCPIPTSLNIEDTKAINVVTDIFSDAGLSRIEYVKGKRTGGLTVLPSLRENGENIILARKTFENLVGYSNIQLALNTIADNIIFDNTGKAVGINVRTSTGIIKTISVLDELIIGTNPIDTVQLLYQSGIGDYEKLQNLNIPAQINLPYVGKEFLVTPLYFGVFYQFPQGTLLNDWESDLASMEYLFGTYQLPSALAPDYYKAFLNIYESREANVILNFRVFSKSMSERLSSYIERLKYIDEGIKDYLMNLCQNYDLLLVVPQLTNVLSRGEILFNKSDYAAELEPIIDTGMYKSKRDITIMQKAIKVLKSLAETETFRSLNGTAVQIPVKQCGEPDFSTEYNRCSIRYLSLANLHYSGGTIMGVNPFTSVVNENCIVHGTKNLRIFSSSVVPYGTSTDSSAVSALIGTYAAKILTQKYQT